MRVTCSIAEIELEGDYGMVPSVFASCSRCAHETESFGTSEACLTQLFVCGGGELRGFVEQSRDRGSVVRDGHERFPFLQSISCERMRALQLDVVLTILDDSASKFTSRVLFKEPYVLAVPDTHRFARRKSVTLADLHDEPFIVRPGRDKFKDASNALVSRGFKIRVVYKTPQIDRTLALIAAGVGLSFIPARLVTPAVKQVQVIDMEFCRTYGLLWAREREDDLKEFIKFAENHSWTV
jgi:DNA-binding transcriptional LysR family regulator